MGRNVELSTPPREELIALRKVKTRDEIALIYDVSVSTVKRWIKVLEIEATKTAKDHHQTARAKAEKRRALGEDDGLTLMEKARVVLGKRMGEDYRGYLLDGRPVRVDVLLRAAGFTVPDIP